MFNILKTELLRHRALALGLALFHFAVLYYLYSLGVSIVRSMQALIWLVICMGFAAGFGVFQMTRYSRDNDWIYLLHRPVALPRIFLALTLAGICLSLLIAVLPLALYVMLMDANGMFGVEGRHYQAIAYAVAVAITAYGCGCFAVLTASRLGFLALGMLTVYVVVEPGVELLFSSLLLIACAFMLALVAFKADRSLPPRRVRTLALTELPIRCGCLLLISASTVWISSLDNYLHGIDRTTNPVPGSDDFVRSLTAKETMQFALERSSHPDASRLDQQVQLGETMTAGPVSFNSYPERGQLTFIDEGLILTDGKEHAVWRFRHDVMLFEGREQDTARPIGWLAPDGIHAADSELPDTRFDSVPWGTADQYLISDNDIYQVTWQDRQVHHRYHSDDADRFNNSLTLGETTSTLFSDSRLYLFDSAELRDPAAALSPRAVLDIVDSSAPDLRRLSILPLRDGYLVSALMGQTPFSSAPAFALLGHPRLDLYHVQGEARELITSTSLVSGASDWTLYRDLVLSPGIRLFNDFILGIRAHASAETTLPLWYLRFPLKIYTASALVCLLCASLTAWMLRRSTLPPRLKIFWIIGNAVTGFAGLLSFYIGYYWKREDLLFIEIRTPSESVATAATSKLGYTN